MTFNHLLVATLGASLLLASPVRAAPSAAQEAPATLSPPEAVKPPGPAPTQTPPAPPAQPPPPPLQEQQPHPPAAVTPSAQNPPAGQWVYTSQYGWVFMPYGNQYVDEGTPDDLYPYAYVYYPDYGWTWVASPWLWGWGPYPYFGLIGPWHFRWYEGLHRSGWAWGRYRGGEPHFGHFKEGLHARWGGLPRGRALGHPDGLGRFRAQPFRREPGPALRGTREEHPHSAMGGGFHGAGLHGGCGFHGGGGFHRGRG